MSIESLVTFGVYFIFLLGVGIYFYKKTTNIEDYLLGGRGMGSWVTALSAQASDMSGWLLMGLPGAIYLSGMSESWIAIGLFIGTMLNWYFVSPRLRVSTEQTKSMTLASYFESRFQDPTGLLRILSSLIILIFFTIYASSGLVAAGKLFEAMFGLDYEIAVVCGAIVIVLYTFLGGFLAVCWTDLFQGALMFFAILIVPYVGFNAVGGFDALLAGIEAQGKSLNIFQTVGGGSLSLIAIISTISWGLGYFGQPHILTRFMSIRSLKDLPKSMSIAGVWVFISLLGACSVGAIAIVLFPDLASSEKEKVFIFMIKDLFSPWVAGILLAAILSAIMSTIDSQLLVSSSVLTEDFYKKKS